MKNKMKFVYILSLFVFFQSANAVAADKTPTPRQLRELAQTLPPYQPNLDCGFEAIRVFEEFGGYLVVARQTGVSFVPDGIYEMKRAVIPTDMYERINGVLSKGWYIWHGKIYLSFPQYGFYEASLKRRMDIATHRGVNMKKNGAHVWNIIDDVVIDISWARQNMETFLETVIVEGEKY